MELMRCKMCGGTVSVNQEQGTVTCDYCGLTMIVPKASDDRLANLLERAGGLRERGEFDKALAIYEIVLAESPRDPAAHWGALLSKYGIEYVEDPTTHTPTPTCRRAQYESILADADYQSALEFASDESERLEFEQEARRIAEIQNGILAVSSQEKPYDVFICYKENSESGTRTLDSTLAQDIYYHLTQDGYRVFFARITLEDKLGREYEPYIFAALNSAKVMVVVGTRPEHFNAVWVRNEWSRFLSIMRKDRSRLLIPCYKDINPYDLPEELSMLQSQDMGKIGFMQDILRGVKKILEEGRKQCSPQIKTSESNTVASSMTGTIPLLERAFMFLEDEEFNRATEYFERVLDLDPKNARAYLGKFLVERKCTDVTCLMEKAEENWFERSNNYRKAIAFAQGSERTEIEGYRVLTISRMVKVPEVVHERTYVEGGSFQMGNHSGGFDNELPVHLVTVDSFFMGTYEVTQDIYEQVMRNNPSDWKGAKSPVENVSWFDAVVFANALSWRDGFDEVYTIDGTDVGVDWSKKGYRLPTEAEWEYAAKGGKKSKGYMYAGGNKARSVAWYSDNSGRRTQQVGTKAANELGLYDMSGNVWEWAWDWYGPYRSSVMTNPTGPSTGSARVIRGGSWNLDEKIVRTALRYDNNPSNRYGDCGFRLVLPAD